MNSWIRYFDFSIFGAALLLSTMGLWFIAIVPGIDGWSRRFFMRFFIVYLLCCLSGLAEVILQYQTVSRTVFLFLVLLESLLLSLPPLMLTAYLLHCCDENLRSSKLLHAVLGLWAIFVALLVSTPFIDGFIYITSENQYYRGPLYPLSLLSLIAIQLLNLAGTIQRRKQLSHKVFLAFLIAILPIMIALITHLFIDVFPLIDISYVCSALAMYGLILSDQIEQDRRRQQQITRQQREIANQRASIMVLQMRPHFIYNTLMSIHSLCRLDPMVA